MTREEAIEILEPLRKAMTDRHGCPISDATIALDVAIEALKAEPKPGRWIWNKRLGNWYCSNCDRIMNPYTVEKSEGLYEMAQPPYCGWCGARMDESTTNQLKVEASINKPTERWDTCGLSENDILVDSGARGERREDAT